MECPRVTIALFFCMSVAWAAVTGCSSGSSGPEPGVKLAVHPDLRPLGLERHIAEFEQRLGVRVELRYVELETAGPASAADLYLTPQCVEAGGAPMEIALIREEIQPVGTPGKTVFLAHPDTPFGRLCRQALEDRRDPAHKIEYVDPAELPDLLAQDRGIVWAPASWVGPANAMPDRFDPWPELPPCLMGQMPAGGREPMIARRLAHFLQAELQYGEFGYIVHPGEDAATGFSASSAIEFSYWAIGSEL